MDFGRFTATCFHNFPGVDVAVCTSSANTREMFFCEQVTPRFLANAAHVPSQPCSITLTSSVGMARNGRRENCSLWSVVDMISPFCCNNTPELSGIP